MATFRSLWRTLKRDPGFSALAVFTLALGIGATTAIFSLVNDIMLEGLPYPESEQMVSIDHNAPALNLPQMGLSRRLYLHYLENTTSFAEIALLNQGAGTLTGGGCWSFASGYVPALGAVRVGANCINPLPSGSVGSLAIVYFEVIGAGSGDFSSGGYVDDIGNYTACESMHPTTSVEAESWGRVKAAYE